MSHSATPRESPYPIMTPGLTRGKQTIPLPLGFQLFLAEFTVLPLFSRLVSQLFGKLHDPKTIAHSCIRNAFLNVETKRPNRNRIPEAKASLRRQSYAWILSTSPNTNLYRRHIPGSSAHMQNHKQARSQWLSEQRRYRESMASNASITALSYSQHSYPLYVSILHLLY